MANLKIKKQRSKAKINFNFPVVVVTRSNKNIMAQVLSDTTKQVIFTFNSNKITGQTKSAKSIEVGKKVAEYLKNNNLNKVIFNRNGYIYHGRVKAIAESIREQGIII
jgi:large subunit ribosomal protein L18